MTDVDRLIPGHRPDRYAVTPEDAEKMRKEIEGILARVEDRKLGKQYLEALATRQALIEKWEDEEERLASERMVRDLKARWEQLSAWEVTHSWLYGHNFVRCQLCGVNKTDMKGPCGFGGPPL